MPHSPASLPVAMFCNHAVGAAWETGLREHLPETPLVVWPQVAAEAESAIVWSPSQAFIDAHPKLRFIFNMGAGVDGLMRLRLPEQARIVRIEDGGMAVQMADYVCHALLRHFREFDVYADSTAAGQWTQRPPRSRSQFPVGVMGLGMLGQRVARTVAAFDFPVFGWSQSPKEIEGVTCLSGADRFDEFLSRTRVLVCLLPLTPATEGILRHDTLSRLQPGGYLINVARGAHLVEDDLLRLIDSGHLAGATLDVTRQEPLPPEHRFWNEPKVVLTPHISAQTVIGEGASQIAAKIRASRQDGALTGVVDPRKGY